MNYKEEIHSYIQNNRTEIIELLKELIRIPSVRGEKTLGAPYGNECQRMLCVTEKLYRDNGFETKTESENGYTLAYYGEGEKTLGLFAHADVVPVSDDWTLTEPFTPIEKDGYIIGRGALDDKSAIVTSLYTAKILKELKIPFNSRLVIFTGCNEETGMEDVKSFVKKHKAPDFSIIADSSFPLYRGNKGQILFNAVSKSSFNEIKSLSASNAKGVILGKVAFTFDYTESLLTYLNENKSDGMEIKKTENEIIFEVTGISKHTAYPEGSLNPAYIAFNILSEYENFSMENRKNYKFLSALLATYYGETMGIENEDEDFGKLTLVNDVLTLEENKLKLHFSLRFGAAVMTEYLKEKVTEEFKNNDFKVLIERDSPAKMTDINNPHLKACLRTYEEFTGEKNAPVHISAGGTYGRHLPYAGEIGLTLRPEHLKDIPFGHGGVHQPDECLNIEGFLEAMELTALMLLECDKI